MQKLIYVTICWCSVPAVARCNYSVPCLPCLSKAQNSNPAEQQSFVVFVYTNLSAALEDWMITNNIGKGFGRKRSWVNSVLHLQFHTNGVVFLSGGQRKAGL